jgi:hypothetical protein
MLEFEVTYEACGNRWRFVADAEPDFVECSGAVRRRMESCSCQRFQAQRVALA